jgi:hypothetical protein
MAMIRRCPADRALVKLFMSGAADPRMEKVLEHLAHCSRCATRFEILRNLRPELDPRIREFQRSFGGSDVDARAALAAAAEKRLAELRPARPASRPNPVAPAFLRRRKSAVAAALFLLVLSAAGVFLSRSLIRPRSTLRSPFLQLKLLEPMGKIDELPGRFKWTPVRHAESYSIRLTDSSLREIFYSGTYLVTEIFIPAEVGSSLIKGESYIWQVRATDGDSNVLVERTGHFILE